MQIHYGLENLPKFRSAVVTIGSYDGVHHGHRTIISRLIAYAKSTNGESVIVTFDPHPRQVVFPDDKSLRLLSLLDEKISLLESTGLDHLIVLPFTLTFSQIDPNIYVEQILIDRIGLSHLIIGYDHKFGLDRKGDYALLKLYAQKGAFTLEEIKEQAIDELHISSTSIRKHIAAGQIEKANRLLVKPYVLSGIVKHGEKVARGLGYPTANIDLRSDIKLVPAQGTYAAIAHCDDKQYTGMLYIGKSKTLSDGNALSIEINLFEHVSDPLYGKNITVHVLKFIRPDQFFDSKEELLYNISSDKIDCELYFSHTNADANVTTAVLNYNGAKHIRTFFPSILRTAEPNHKIVLIDNASTDDSVIAMKSISDQVQLIQLDDNLGFAGGYTSTMARVRSKYVAIVNSDVEVTDNWLAPLIKALDTDESIVAVQPKILSYADKEKFEYAGAAGGFIDNLGYPFCRGRILDQVEQDTGQHNQPINVAWTSGAAMVVRTALFRQAGGFDPDFFAHMEEIDLCWRWRNAGYKLQCIPESIVYHLGGGTLNYQSPRKAFLNLRNNYWMILKNEQSSSLFWKLPLRIIIDFSYASQTAISGRPAEAMGITKGIFVGLCKATNIGSKRRASVLFKKRYGINEPNFKGVMRGPLVLKLIAGKKLFRHLKHQIKL